MEGGHIREDDVVRELVTGLERSHLGQRGVAREDRVFVSRELEEQTEW